MALLPNFPLSGKPNIRFVCAAKCCLGSQIFRWAPERAGNWGYNLILRIMVPKKRSITKTDPNSSMTFQLGAAIWPNSDQWAINGSSRKPFQRRQTGWPFPLLPASSWNPGVMSRGPAATLCHTDRSHPLRWYNGKMERTSTTWWRHVSAVDHLPGLLFMGEK